MATPTVSASVAILYQYLQEQYSHRGMSGWMAVSLSIHSLLFTPLLSFTTINISVSCFIESIDIRASLLKAMIAHSAVPTEGYCLKNGCTRYRNSAEIPAYEGWGRVQLDQVIKVSESPFELFLYYGQLNDKKEEVTITVPISISFY